MTPTILISAQVSSIGTDFLKKRGYNVRILSEATAETIVKEAKGCDAMLVRGETISGQMMEQMDSIKILARHGAGIDRVDVDTATRLGIQITNTPTSNGNAVAEHTAALMLSLARNIPNMNTAVRRGMYKKANSEGCGIELGDAVVGVLGLGNIGLNVASKLSRGFGAKIMGYDPFVSGKSLPEYISYCRDIKDVLKAADFITVHMPLTDSTRCSIGMEEFKLMKPQAYFLNLSRSKIVDEEALYKALRCKVIAGAAIDVFEPEPPDASAPIFQLENVIFTPHIGGATKSSLEQTAVHAAMCIHQALSGEEVSWKVNHPVNPRIQLPA